MILGGAYMLLGSVCGGSFGLPSKYVRPDTPWEVLWGPFFLFVTILIPCTVAPLVVNDLCGIYARVGMSEIIPVLLFGLLWGLGSMTLGMSFAFIGLSLAYALNYGAQIAFGSMMPMLLFDREHILTPHGYVILAGVAVCLIGVVVSGRAGILKDRSLKQDASTSQPERPTDVAIKKPKVLVGLIIGVVSGILCACYAVASGYAGPIKVETLHDHLNSDLAAAWAVTAMILWGGAVSACLYCIIQLTRNKTWDHFARPGVALVLALAAVMAVLHDAAIFFFALGWINLGDNLGISVGYPIFMSFAIIVGNVHGFRTGEWKGASRQSVAWIVAGMDALCARLATESRHTQRPCASLSKRE